MPNNDYVKREDIFPAVTEIAKEIVFGNQDDDKVVDIINSIPAADVEPVRHGWWVGMREYCQHLYDTTGERYTMSQLGISLPHCNQCWAENESRKPFCPNCGAHMDAEPPREDEDAEGH